MSALSTLGTMVSGLRGGKRRTQNATFGQEFTTANVAATREASTDQECITIPKVVARYVASPPVHEVGAMELQARFDELEGELNGLRRQTTSDRAAIHKEMAQLKVQLRARNLGVSWPELDMSFMMRHAAIPYCGKMVNAPAFLLLERDPRDGKWKFDIAIHTRRNSHRMELQPAALGQRFGLKTFGLADWSAFVEEGRTKTLILSCALPDPLPAEVKDLADQEQKAGTFDSLAVVVANPGLENKMVPWEDPLLVGFIGDTCLVLAQFDLKPSEAHVVSEFTHTT